jgi:hypothetical protein
MVLAIAQPVVGNLVGNFAGNLLGNFTSPAITALTGYGLGMLAEKTGIARTLAHPLKVLGLSTAVIQIVQPYVSNLLGGATAAAPAGPQLHGWPQGYSGWNPQRIGRFRRPVRRGFPMRGIGMMTGIPPVITAPPAPVAPPANATAGMHGMGMRPGVWAH